MAQVRRSFLILALLSLFLAMPCLCFAASVYRLGPGDTLAVTVFEEPDSSGVFKISNKGEILHPLLGSVKVEGLTTDEAQSLMISLLKKYMLNPVVSIEITDYQSKKVWVFGDMNKTGKFPLKEDATLLQILIEAGGPKGQTGTITILRNFLKQEALQPGMLESAPKSLNEILADAGTVQTITVDFNQLFNAGGLSKNVFLDDGDIIYVPSSDTALQVGGN